MNMPARCPWVDMSKADYVAYHDLEWGVPVLEDQKMFEFLTLESAQAGLSWYTVLRKRENYRKAFNQFDPIKIAAYDEKKVEALMQDSGLIRNRAKINAAVNNARCFLELTAKHGSFTQYLWQFVNGRPIINQPKSLKDYPATSTESDAMSKELKRLGFKFVGSTICYAHMQATGMVNDHASNCFCKQPIIDGYPQLFS